MDKMKPSETEILQKILKKLHLVPVISLPSVEAGLILSEILLRCDLPVAEITFRTSCASEAIAAIKKEYPELLLLAGTVLTPPQVDLAIESGAAAIVSPGFTPQMAAYCKKEAVPFFPGVCTPSEVQMAMDAGLTSLKFFPAENSGGTQMLSLFHAIYPEVTFMPTGGINLENIVSYLHLNNVVCCGGTWLAPEQLIVDGEWKEIEKRIIAAVKSLLL